MKTLQDWKDQSPNNTRGNTLIEGRTPDGNRYFYWNLKPVDPHETAARTLPDGVTLIP